MENPKKNNVQGTYHTLRECLTDPEYLAAQRRMEEIQRRSRKYFRDNDIEPADWDDITI